MVHEPGVEMFYGLLEPNSFLYDRAFDESHAIKEHKELVNVLENDFNVKVVHLKSILLEERNTHDLYKKAEDTIRFDGDDKKVKHAKKTLKENSTQYDPRHFLNILLLKPTVKLDELHDEIIPSVNLRTPLANLFYMRDQQILADNGFIIGKPKKPQRAGEEFVTKTALELMRAKIVGEVKSGSLEGGDFIPAGDVAFIGKGDRTDENGIQNMMKNVSFDEIVVVNNPRHYALEKPDPMVTMHLDTYFNIADDGVAVSNKKLMESAKIEIWQKVRKGEYEKSRSKKYNLLDYVKKLNFDIIDITTLEQLCFASNFLCIGDGKIIAVDTKKVAARLLLKLNNEANEKPEYRKLLEIANKDEKKLRLESQFFPNKKAVAEAGLDCVTVRLDNITGGYGAIHCMTCPLNRGN